MLKRPYIFAILIVFFAAGLFLAIPGTTQTVKTLDKSDHAERLWSKSPHADKTAEAFKHWDAEGSVPTTCAKCHSTPGYRDYIGADGSAVNTVDKAAALGTTIECAACHADPENGIVHNRTNVIFPSGVEVKGLGPEALCMECHQGRASTKTVDDSIAAAALPDDDTASSKLRFINIHYFAASATQFGSAAKGGYQYAGKEYDHRFAHIPGYNACNTCHNPHSLEVEMEACNTCHTGIKDPRDIRYYGSFVDYDGDGDISEGMYYEIEQLKGMLYDTIRAYASTVLGAPIAYDGLTYPYFFNDPNNNGVVDTSEANTANGYSKFSARLLRAAYNYQVTIKDPNGFAHNGKYLIELIFDSIEDLNTKIEGGAQASGIFRPGVSGHVLAAQQNQSGEKVRRLPKKGRDLAREDQVEPPFAAEFALSEPALGQIHRTDEGHFDGSSMAFRDWDDSDSVPSTCAKCHSAEGLPYFLENGKIDKNMPISNGFLCATCHTSPPHTRFAGPVTFPSGDIKDLGDASNLCLNCHQGRASKRTVDTAIAAGPGPYGFTNIHYFPAAASFFGSEVRGGYEFAGKTYKGRNVFTNHGGIFTNCVECHFGTKSFNRKLDDSDALFHNTEPSKEDCVLCHGQDISQPHPGADPEKFEFEGIRPAQTPDYDADGNTKESLEAELDGLENALYARLQAYGNSIGAPVAYDENAYPYFFKDLNGNGVVDAAEAVSANGYRFTAPMLRGAYDFQFSKKEPCGYIHNPLYIAQLLVDSIGHLGGDIKPYTWR